MKKYQVKINEVEVEEIQNLGPNIGQSDDNRRRIETYIRILRVAEAVIFFSHCRARLIVRVAWFYA